MSDDSFHVFPRHGSLSSSFPGNSNANHAVEVERVVIRLKTNRDRMGWTWTTADLYDRVAARSESADGFIAMGLHRQTGPRIFAKITTTCT